MSDVVRSAAEDAPDANDERRLPKRIPFRARLPQPSLEYRSAFGRWLGRGESVDERAGPSWGGTRGGGSSG